MADLYYKIMTTVIAVGAIVFPVVYHRTAAWWRSQAGWHLMGYSLTVAMMATSGLIRLFLPDDPIQRTVRMVLLALAGIFVWHRTFVYLRTQRAARGGAADERTDA